MKKIEELEFVEILELGIKISKEVVGKMTFLEAESYCKENNAKLLNVLQAGYIFDNDFIKDFCKEREWLEHYSKRTRKAGLACSALGGSLGDGWLKIYGSMDDDDRNNVFWVRLVFPIDDKAHS